MKIVELLEVYLQIKLYNFESYPLMYRWGFLADTKQRDRSALLRSFLVDQRKISWGLLKAPLHSQIY